MSKYYDVVGRRKGKNDVHGDIILLKEKVSLRESISYLKIYKEKYDPSFYIHPLGVKIAKKIFKSAENDRRNRF